MLTVLEDSLPTLERHREFISKWLEDRAKSRHGFLSPRPYPKIGARVPKQVLDAVGVCPASCIAAQNAASIRTGSRADQ